MATLLLSRVTPAVGRPARPATTAMVRSHGTSSPSNQVRNRCEMSSPVRKNVATMMRLNGTGRSSEGPCR